MKFRRYAAMFIIAAIIACTFGCGKETEAPLAVTNVSGDSNSVNDADDINDTANEEVLTDVPKEIISEEEAEDFFYKAFSFDNSLMANAYLNEYDLKDNGGFLLSNYSSVCSLVNLWNRLYENGLVEGNAIESWDMYEGFPSDMISDEDDCYFWSWSEAFKVDDIQKAIDFYFGEGIIDVAAYEGSDSSYVTESGYLLYIPEEMKGMDVISKLKGVEVCEDRAFLYLERLTIDKAKLNAVGINGNEWLEEDINSYFVNRSLNEAYDTYFKYVDIISAEITKCTVEVYKNQTGVHYKNIYYPLTGEYKVVNEDGTVLFGDYRLSNEVVVGELKQNDRIYVYLVVFYGDKLGEVMYLSEEGKYKRGYVRMSDVEMITE